MPTASASRTITAPQQQVWDALSDIENAPRWNVAWTGIEFTSPQPRPVGPGATFRAHTADGHTFDFEITEWVPPERITFAPIRRDETERYVITLESQAFLLHPSDDGTLLELTSRASTRGIRGLFIGLFFWRGYHRAGLNAALDAVQALFEPADGDGSASEASDPSSTG